MADHHSDRALGEKLVGLAGLADRINELGATGAFPAGRFGPNDEGELVFRVGLDSDARRIRIDFGKPVKELGLKAENAEEIGAILLRLAKELRDLEAEG